MCNILALVVVPEDLSVQLTGHWGWRGALLGGLENPDFTDMQRSTICKIQHLREMAFHVLKNF